MNSTTTRGNILQLITQHLNLQFQHTSKKNLVELYTKTPKSNRIDMILSILHQINNLYKKVRIYPNSINKGKRQLKLEQTYSGMVPRFILFI